ncbi:putative isochorismatase hydrolase protein [Botryosphaeria dothidea]|uniref:Isochorismatase hydrolase protein n=1 Tax=Botryosphaeria dothidea TaxID=55169 RepID=A0A8H4ILU2_9PEZI|nr:putative isochorismatase hydrolase protein [Botryosphaeria dothidea]
MAFSGAGLSHLVVDARPFPFSFPSRHTALLVIGMQRDFLACVRPVMRLLDACREARLPVFHTRVGFKPDLSDCPSITLARQAPAHGNAGITVGDKGSMGRYLVRGEYGHDIIDELRPLAGEVVIDKSGKGAFWNTELLHKLKARAITHVLVAGVSTECCLSSTVREASDRGLECCLEEFEKQRPEVFFIRKCFVDRVVVVGASVSAADIAVDLIGVAKSPVTYSAPTIRFSASSNIAMAALDAENAHPDDVAIIGLAFRGPGDASSPGRLWDMLVEGRSAFSSVPQNKWSHQGHYHPSAARGGGYSSNGGYSSTLRKMV